MTINRASMGSQLKGNKMKKKPVKKMIVGGDVSPLAGAITGKGMMGRALGKGLRNVSPLGRLISDEQRKKKEAAAGAVAQAAQPAQSGSQSMKAQGMAGMTPMYGGGAVKKKRDGCAIKGKTKGTIR